MPWKPIHEAHAIEKVRISVRFDAVASPKVVEKASAEIRERHKEYGFDEILRVSSGNVATLKIGADGLQFANADDEASKGWSLRMAGDDAALEELRFGGAEVSFATTRYGRWAHLAERLDSIFYPILDGVSGTVNFVNSRLEFWDRFVFDGEPDAADFAEVIDEPNRFMPGPVVAEGGLWHSHTGWFENVATGRHLINRHFDAVDQDKDDEAKRRTIGIYTLVEYRPTQDCDDAEHLREMLEEMHRRSNILFGSDLTAEMREAIGLNLGEYR